MYIYIYVYIYIVYICTYIYISLFKVLSICNRLPTSESSRPPTTSNDRNSVAIAKYVP